MGFAFPLLLALLWLSSSVDGFWLGGVRERDAGGHRLQRREMDCKPGYTDCGRAGCILKSACCNAAAGCGLQ